MKRTVFPIKFTEAILPKFIMVSFFVLLSLLTIGSLNLFFRQINPLNILIGLTISLGIFIYTAIGQKIVEKRKISIERVRKFSFIITCIILIIILLIYSQVRSASDQEGLFAWPFMFWYWDQFDYMIPMGMFCGILVKWFGLSGALLAFRMMNLWLMLLAFWSLGKITEKLFIDTKIATIYYLIAPLCVQFNFFISWAYGNIPSICLMIFALYLLIRFFENAEWKYILLVILIAFIALAFKLQAQVMMIAIMIVLMIRLFHLFSMEERIKRIKTAILVIGLLFVLLFTMPFFRLIANSIQDDCEIDAFVSLINVAQGIAAYDEQDKIDYQKLSEEQHLNLPPISELTGAWSYIIDSHTMTGYHDDDFAKKRSIERIKYRLNEFAEDPKMAIRFFLRKQLSGWATPDFSALQAWGVKNYFNGESYQNDPNKPYLFTVLQPGYKGYNIVYYFANGYETFIYLSSAIGIFFVLRNKKWQNNLFTLIIPLTFLGQFLLSLFTESGGRYNFYVFVLLLPFSAVGTFCVIEKTDKILENKLYK